MKYSFDDKYIGKTKTNNHLETREIKRPVGFTRKYWYETAALTCKMLNDESFQ